MAFRSISAALLLFSVLAFSPPTSAQRIDSKDESNVSFSADSLAHEKAMMQLDKCPTADQWQSVTFGRSHSEKLQLTILRAESHLLADTTEITATVRLKNESPEPVLLPWRTAPLDTPRTVGSKDRNKDKNKNKAKDKENYEAATLRLTLGTDENRTSGAYLAGRVELQATPHQDDQYVKLLQGQWVEITFKTLAICRYDKSDPPAFCDFKPDQHAQLIAHWEDQIYPGRAQGCHPASASTPIRQMESDAVEINFAFVNHPRTPNPSTPPHKDE